MQSHSVLNDDHDGTLALSVSTDHMAVLSGSMGQTMSHYALLSAKSNAAAATLEVHAQG